MIMPRDTRSRSHATRTRPTAEFTERVRTSAFRVLGLSARATQRDVLESERRIATTRTLDALLGGLGVAPLQVDDAAVREAVTRLTSPAGRCLERTMWFMGLPHEHESLADRPTPDAHMLDHDTALVALLTRFRCDPDLTTHDEWVRALRRWQEDVSRLASCLGDIETDGGHDAPATTAQIQAAVAYASGLPLRAVAGIGRFASLTGDWERVAAAAYIVGEAAPDERNAKHLRRQLLHPTADDAWTRFGQSPWAKSRSVRATKYA